MDFFDHEAVVSVNDDRTALDKATSEKAGEANHRVWYEIDPDVMYPAAIDWLKANGQELLALANTPVGDLVEKALNGDKAAAFTLKCQQYAPKNLGIIPLDQWDAAWELAMTPRDEMPADSNQLFARELALEAARLFVTEVTHQAAGQPMGLHISKSDRWRL